MGFTIIIIYRHVYHSCTVSTSSTFDIPKIWKTWHIRGSKGSGKVGEFEEGRKIKGSLLVIGRGRGAREGDTEGQRDTRTIHALARRSLFQSHWRTNQGMAVTSFIIRFFNLLNVCHLSASFSSYFRFKTSLVVVLQE